jgi:hypothetical protein
MRAVATPGRWIWGLSGLVTMVALALPGIRLITSGGQAENAQPQATVTRTVTVTQPVTSLTVQSYGAPVQITAGPVRRVQITETIMYDSQAGNLSAVPQPASASPVSDPPTGPQPAPVSDPPAGAQPAPGGPLSGMPAVVQSVSGGRLSLSAPACATSGCSVSFALTVPPDVTATVSTEGGPVTVSGIAGANLDSGDGPVRATEIGGPLTVITGGGSLMVDGLTGPLLADTGSGSLTVQDVASATATVTTGGGDAWMAFSTAPDTVTLNTDSGSAQLAVPGGPYALIAENDGGPQSVGIATDPGAHRSITVISGGGPLVIRSSAGRLPRESAPAGQAAGGGPAAGGEVAPGGRGRRPE